MIAQIIVPGEKGDIALVCANSSELKKYGYTQATGNTTSAYLTGMLIGYKAQKKDISEAILDIGLYQATKGGRIFATLKGAIDSGMSIPHNPEIFPSDERIAKNSDEFETVKAKIGEIL